MGAMLEALEEKCEAREKEIEELKEYIKKRDEAKKVNFLAQVKDWTETDGLHKKEVLELEQHKINLKQQRKVLEQDIKFLKEHDSSRQQENAALQEENMVLKEDNYLLHRVKEEMAAEIIRVMQVCVATKARNDRTIAALSKIFAEQQEVKNQDAITQAEEKVIDCCLRKLTDEERAKFLCECGSLDGGFVFRNQVRREMDAIARDPRQMAELMGEAEDIENGAKTLHDAVEGPSEEVQKRGKREKRKEKGSRRH